MINVRSAKQIRSRTNTPLSSHTNELDEEAWVPNAHAPPSTSYNHNKSKLNPYQYIAGKLKYKIAGNWCYKWPIGGCGIEAKNRKDGFLGSGKIIISLNWDLRSPTSDFSSSSSRGGAWGRITALCSCRPRPRSRFKRQTGKRETPSWDNLFYPNPFCFF